MKYRNILITGGAGFIGSNMGVHIKRRYPKTSVTALDNLKRRGSELNIPRLRSEGVLFIHGDVRCREDLVHERRVDLIIECSAEPSVTAFAQDNPEYIIQINLNGMVNCLELARRDTADIIFLSTSRVYPYGALNSLKVTEGADRFVWKANPGRIGWSEAGVGIDFTTDGPKSLYGATKLACELLMKEYIANYGIKGIINRCGVIAGPWQFGKADQGIFALWMMSHYFRRPLCYIGWGGEGKQVRDLLHVDDLVSLIDMQMNDMKTGNGKVYNVGGGRDISLSLKEAAGLCRKITGKKVRISSESKNRPFDVRVYISDNRDVREDYEWRPKADAERILFDTHNWLKKTGPQLMSCL